ncbi:MAG: hypothetical protein O2999_09500, partial [Nitrospirae bacterium]|nr:hypothetical protein [Nitrospirota bacterium]
SPAGLAAANTVGRDHMAENGSPWVPSSGEESSIYELTPKYQGVCATGSTLKKNIGPKCPLLKTINPHGYKVLRPSLGTFKWKINLTRDFWIVRPEDNFSPSRCFGGLQI